MSELRHLFQCCILIPRKCPRKTPFQHTVPPPQILAGQIEVHITFYFRRIWSYLPLQIFRPSYSPAFAKVLNLANYCTGACPAILPLPSTFLPICLVFHNGARNNEVYILSGPSMKYGRPEDHASLSHSGCVLRQYLILWKK